MRFATVVILFSGYVEACSIDDFSKNDGIDYVMKNMPAADVGVIDRSRIEAEVDAALRVRNRFSWAREVPWDIYRDNVLPYALLDEKRDEWRHELETLASPLVESCRTGRDATLAIASNIAKVFKVKYSAERRKPNQSPKESMVSGKASCTGQSILLANALRSVGIPARVAGVLLWSHAAGNHTWTEAWCDGNWEMIECDEKDFNSAWVMENIGMLDTNKEQHRLFASSWTKRINSKAPVFPMAWKMKVDLASMSLVPEDESGVVPGVDVTERYVELAKKWYGKYPAPPKTQRLYVEHRRSGCKRERIPVEVVLRDKEGNECGRGVTPSSNDDMRRFLSLYLPEDKACLLEWNSEDGRRFEKKVEVTDAPVQIVRLED